MILLLHQIILYILDTISQKAVAMIDGKIIDEKLQYYINREAAKISASLSGKIVKHECFTGQEKLPTNQS